jgi:hypothetical protein
MEDIIDGHHIDRNQRRQEHHWQEALAAALDVRGLRVVRSTTRDPSCRTTFQWPERRGSSRRIAETRDFVWEDATLTLGKKQLFQLFRKCDFLIFLSFK